jgi:hypothetical protein
MSITVCIAGLPSFFQNSGTTVLQELSANLELDVGLEDKQQDIDALNGLIDDEFPLDDQETFGEDAFGDLKMELLPDFFAASKMDDLRIDEPQIISTPIKNDPLGLPPGLSHAPITPAPPGMMMPVPPMPTPSPAFASMQNVPYTVSLTPRPLMGPATGCMSMYTPSPYMTNTPQRINPVYSLQQQQQTFSSPYPIRIPSTPLSVPNPPSPVPSTPSSQVIGAPFFSTPRLELGRGDYMSASDVRFVASKVLQALETNDPYTDDYYYLQLQRKRNLTARDLAQHTRPNAPLPPLLPMPSPAWKDTKERIKLQVSLSRQHLVHAVKEWESKEQVLGHRIRTEVTKPREQLALPDMHDIDFTDYDNEDEGEWKAPFSSRLWSTRGAVQRGYDALFTIQELETLATSPMVGNNPLAMEEIRREMETAVDLLSESLGILNRHGEVAGQCSLDGRHVAAIMQTTIGRKLLCRGLKLLSPQQRWALVPVVLARALMAAAAAPGQQPVPANPEAQMVECRLLHSISDFISHCYQTHMQGGSLSIASENAALELLSQLRQCVKNVIITHMEKRKQLRDTLLSEKARAELMHLIVQVGDNVSLETDAQHAEEWMQTKEAFMAMLDD